MGRKLNNREQKEAKKFLVHNRKAGHAKFWKHRRNRFKRRQEHKTHREIVESWQT